MKKLAVIANQHAGRGRALRSLHEAKRMLWGWELDFLYPKSIEELWKTCAELDPKEYEAAVVLGGDGTVNQAIRGLVKSGVPLYPFPSGTANDLAAELGIKADWTQAQSLIDSKRTEWIDLVEVNSIPFATVAGIGVGAVLAAEFNERRQSSWFFREAARRLQSQVYSLLSAKTVLTRSDFIRNLHIRSDVFEDKMKTAVLLVCNQAKLGGDLKVAPSSINDDRKFSVLVIPGARSYQLIRALVQLKIGKLPKDFILFSTDKLVVRDLKSQPVRAFGDGEILTENPQLEFKIVPKGLRVYRDRRGAERDSRGVAQ